METENSVESKLLLSCNFSRDIPQTEPNNEAMITTENEISDNLVTLAGNSTSPKTTLVNSSDIIENVKAGNSLGSMLLLPVNFSRDISQNVKENEQLVKNTTYPNNEATISAENNTSNNLETSARNSTSTKTTLVNSNDTGIMPNNFSIDISQNVKLDKQFIKNTTYPNIEASVSKGSNVSDYLIILAEETKCMNTSENSNEAAVMENGKSGSSLELTSSPQTNFSKDSQNAPQAEQINKSTLFSQIEATARRENDIPDYLITLTRESNPISTSVNTNENDKIIENYEDDEDYIDETSNDIQ
ncbi:rho GTPase-activating protein gacZ-like [Maniola hyperantus]|uniref:rho GTPase-activating protein gacZ-like n=1 Tax=Aphantopus hyperantus TaxID=2795564 RepID=UPI003748B924